MSDSRPVRIRARRTAALCLVVLALAAIGCASKRVRKAAPGQPAEEPVPAAPEGPAVEQLYERLAMSRALYETGIGLIAEGEEVLGEANVAEASGVLREAAEACALDGECELERFFATFDYLLNEQAIALKRQAFQIEELRAAALAQDVEREPGTSPFVASMPELRDTVSLLRGTDLSDLISLNGPVNAAIDDWLTWLRPNLLSAYEYYQYLRAEMAPVYEEAGLPEALLFAMIATESGGKVHAYSRAGAAGPLQFTRRTGQLYGLYVQDGFDLRLDPASSTRANVAYLNEQFEALNNSLEMALGAYNGGEQRMLRLHGRHEDASFWDHRIYYSLPRETREYVPRVLAAAWLFLHPKEYNLRFPPVDVEVVQLVVRQPVALGELSVCLGQEGSPSGWFRTLRNLNPRLEPGDRLEAGETIRVPASLVPLYEARCLEGEIVDRARLLHDANYPEEPEMILYTVRRGDTLSKIASRFRCASMRQIAEINNLRAPRYVIREGQQLKIPPCS